MPIIDDVVMKKLLVTTVAATAVLAIVGSAQARDVTARVGIDGLTECRDTAIYNDLVVTESTCWAASLQRSVKVIWDGNNVGAVDDGERLIVKNGLWRPGEPKWTTFYCSKRGQLPACDAADVVKILARSTNTTLSGIFSPTAISASNGKNICTAGIRTGTNYYTVTWTDQVAGRYWVQFTLPPWIIP
jgi:hypothetical protein